MGITLITADLWSIPELCRVCGSSSGCKQNTKVTLPSMVLPELGKLLGSQKGSETLQVFGSLCATSC